jgi:NADPH-dependent 7-cyano-7-deazaguanine reductase QueF
MLVGHVPDPDRREIGLTREQAEARELGHRHRDLVVAVRMRVRHYMWSYRDEGVFHEDVTNRILNDFVAAAHPRWVEVTGEFNVRGGIKTEVRASYGKRSEV